MQRREFITLIGSAAAAWPLRRTWTGRPLPTRGYIAWLGSATRGHSIDPYLDSLRTGLRELGWVEGRNLENCRLLGSNRPGRIWKA